MRLGFTFGGLLAAALALGGGVWPPAARAQDAAAHKLKGPRETCTNPDPIYARLAGMTVGFSQSQSEQDGFRAAETGSIKAEAQELGVRLLYANADGSQPRQLADLDRMIGQGARALIVAPVAAAGLQPALMQAAARGIPVVTLDRQIAATFCRDFLTLVGSDFYRQGARAAEALAKATKGKVYVAVLQGAAGDPATGPRTDGFGKEAKKHPRIHPVAQHGGDGSGADAQAALRQLLAAHPEINAVYAQSDAMALGAIAAVHETGGEPGRDVTVVSIGGSRAVVQAVADGHVQADVQTDARLGPAAFLALQDWFDGKPVPQRIAGQDRLYTAADAAAALAQGVPY